MNDRSTHNYDDEIEPTPRVSEILLEAERRHFDDELNDEDDGEYLIHDLERFSQGRAVRKVHVLQGLQ